MGTKYTNNNISIPLGLQYQNMKKAYSAWNCTLKRGALTCSGFIQPLDMSESYKIQIRYIRDEKPKITVLKPELVLELNGFKIPHYYDDGYLCVFYPYDKEWTPAMMLSETIIPWISSWLYFYEVWLATESWEGGGIHLKKNSIK